MKVTYFYCKYKDDFHSYTELVEWLEDLCVLYYENFQTDTKGTTYGVIVPERLKKKPLPRNLEAYIERYYGRYE